MYVRFACLPARPPIDGLWRVFGNSLSLDNDDDIAGNKVTLLSVVVCKTDEARELRKKQWDNGTMEYGHRGDRYRGRISEITIQVSRQQTVEAARQLLAKCGARHSARPSPTSWPQPANRPL